MNLERSDFALYDALKANSTDPVVVARHRELLALGIKEKVIIVYHDPPISVRVASQEVSPRASGRPVAAACGSGIRLTNPLGGRIHRFPAAAYRLELERA